MDFSYLDGPLDVTHRHAGPDGWEESTGSISGRSLLGGAANVASVSRAGAVLGVSLKVLDPTTGTWTVWWVDAATGTLSPPLRGRWADDDRIRLAGIDADGALCADVVSAVTATSARWEQSRSTDGGRTWTPEWTMAMARRSAPDPDPPPAGEFAFLARSLQVEHRRRARRGEGWEEFTSVHRGATLLGGAVSIDEVGLPDGGAGMTFRVRDAATGSWSIWWVNGGVGRLEPPVHGRFGADGIGTFVGAEDDQLVRFTWSDTTTDRPHWTQELSTDGG
ncbi:MAG TPA: hypothetical protein VGO60_17270, partial [Iamia sp.]|nr:hypothetical protein [Iamia sp.]